MTTESLTSQEARERLEADVAAVAQAHGDRVFSRAHLLQRFTDEALERVLMVMLDHYSDDF